MEFVKGDQVEVCSKEDGFLGSYFGATVLSKNPEGSYYKVKYKNRVTEEDESKRLIETIEMRVHIDCVGCESRVKTALQKMRGVDEVEIDMLQQKVTVTGYADQKKVLKKVRKTGRRAELWQLPYNPDHNDGSSSNGGYFYNPHGCNGPINHAAPVPTSSYNYYKHGYDSNDYSSYRHHPVHASIFSHQTGSKFSDENPNACSVM